jgi:hypothetical protein
MGKLCLAIALLFAIVAGAILGAALRHAESAGAASTDVVVN